MARHNYGNISNYTPMSQGGMDRAVGAVQYYSHREDSGGNTQYRSGFDTESDNLSKTEMLDSLSDAKDAGAKYVYTLVVSPDHRRGERDLKEYTRDVIDGLFRERHGKRLHWKAIIHDNQNDHPHVHVVMLTDTVLRKWEFRGFNYRVDKAWPPKGKEYERTQEREPEHQQERGAEWDR